MTSYPHRQPEPHALDAVMADMGLAKIQPCKLCNKPTTGSIGAAGNKWPSICQPCKDAEDAAAISVCVHVSAFFKKADPYRTQPIGKSRVCCVCESNMHFRPGESDTGIAASWECSNPDCEHQENDE